MTWVCGRETGPVRPVRESRDLGTYRVHHHRGDTWPSFGALRYSCRQCLASHSAYTGELVDQQNELLWLKWSNYKQRTVVTSEMGLLAMETCAVGLCKLQGGPRCVSAGSNIPFAFAGLGSGRGRRGGWTSIIVGDIPGIPQGTIRKPGRILLVLLGLSYRGGGEVGRKSRKGSHVNRAVPNGTTGMVNLCTAEYYCGVMPRISRLVANLARSLGSRQQALREFRWIKESTGSHSDSSQGLLADRLLKRTRGWPLQYILGGQRSPDVMLCSFSNQHIGTQPFGSIEILTRPPTLIPRPETEYWTLRLAQTLRSHKFEDRPLRVLDLCTGTACIPLLLCDSLPPRTISALGVDNSLSAVELANENISNCGFNKSGGNTVHVWHSDIFAQDFVRSLKQHVKVWEPFDVLTSNPPYIPRQEYDKLSHTVRLFEDPLALLGEVPPSAGESEQYSDLGIDLFPGGSQNLVRPGGHIALEVGEGQARLVEEMILPFVTVCAYVNVENTRSALGFMLGCTPCSGIRPGRRPGDRGRIKFLNCHTEFLYRLRDSSALVNKPRQPHPVASVMEAPESTPPAHLILILDISPVQWQLSASSTANGGQGMDLSTFLSQVLVFVNCHLGCRQENSAAILGAFPGRSLTLYPAPASTQSNTGLGPESESNTYHGFRSVDDVLMERIQSELASMSESDTQNLIQAYRNQQNIRAPTKTRKRKGGSIVSLHYRLPHPDIVCVARCFDTIYPIHELHLLGAKIVPIDVCRVFGPDTIFLQQASYLTRGCYLNLDSGSSLLQSLTMCFLPSASLRNTIELPSQGKVDFRASCFCHKEVVDMGYVCSVCLSIFCKPVVVCATCKIKFPIASYKKMLSATAITKLSGAKPKA
ncbi:Tfb4 domain-containing protein [Rhizoctonia solani AG-1 IA]|uniref:General transcription and DNA repair factor IIH subunit TFB4 n=1 Tax=Thanatephorus cucumeris (strain AG1-IA) TaxID=983506 RepID=L8X0A7_THACA|nr:Tfb4 domain-containing protein [Rhizoctonia solani AG-1 IA]